MQFDKQQTGPKWDDETSPDELKQALKERRFKDAEMRVKALLAELEERPRRVPTEVATRVLSTLRGFAWFDDLHAVAAALESGGQTDVEVQRQLAQARIEQDSVTGAIDGLQELAKTIEEELADGDLFPTDIERLKYEKGEVMGLLGRSYKQLYVDAKPNKTEPRVQDYERARDFYGEAYKQGLGDYLWHGVNYIALLTHGRRVKKGNPTEVSNQAMKHAERILAEIDARERANRLTVWDLPNRAECFLASGENPKAVEALQGYLSDDEIEPFNIQSTRRQLIELWMLNEEDYPGSVILPMMNARYSEMAATEGPVDLSPADAPKYERVYGDTGYQPLQWLQKALERARCIARLGPDKFEGWGTGFLFDGAWIGEKFADRHLLLTNSHVVSDDPEVQAQFPNPKGPEENTAVFLGGDKGGSPELEIRELLWTSPPTELDATLLEIDPPPEGSNPPPLAKSLPPAEGEGARVNVIGHPRGLTVRVSLQDNEMVNVGDRYIHYRTPTDPGSSGSPVFNQKWQLVALHHASSSALSANEGVRMDRLIEAMKKDLL